MTEEFIKARFAPSPTGLLHIGNVRTALFNALLAQGRHGVFLLRIEDTDRERSRDEYTGALMADLRWLGMEWQEGPDVAGPHGPYCQSQRDGIYRHHFEALEGRDLAYPCFCSPRELELSRKAQLSAGRPPRYAGTCARLNEAERATRLARGIAPTLRFRVSDGQVVEFNDYVRGPQKFKTDDIGDFIIRRADGTPSFFFTNAIDDALMGVTHVLRGEDHITNTPRQLLLLEALGLRTPGYGHISLIVADNGAPLSKRLGSRSVQELRESGFMSLAVVNYLARLGHVYEGNGFMTYAQLAENFSIEKLGRSPARYDDKQLMYWQQEAIAAADEARLWQWMGASVHEWVPEAARAAFINAVRANVVLPPDAAQWARVVFGDEPVFTDDAKAAVANAAPGFFDAAIAALADNADDFKALANGIKGALDVKGKALFQPLRAALTGRLDGPEMGQLLPLIGVDRAGARFGRCRDRVY